MNVEAAKLVLAKHPKPWRVTDEYRKWVLSGDMSSNPEAIVDANNEPVIHSSEWLHMSAEVADYIVSLVNGDQP